MFILLPPSESKQVAFEGPTFELSGLRAFPAESPEIQAARSEIWTGYLELLGDPERACRVLKLGRNPRLELEWLTGQAARVGVPAIQRYNGVLYAALTETFTEHGPFSLTELRNLESRGHKTLIQSALFGLVSAVDDLPYYRYSASTVLTGRSAKRFWAGAYSGYPNAFAGEMVFDFRSQAYRSLAPVDATDSYYVVSVYEGEGGKALNHFNKRAKGKFTAALLLELLAEAEPTRLPKHNLSQWIQRVANKAKLGVELDRNQIRLRV